MPSVPVAPSCVQVSYQSLHQAPGRVLQVSSDAEVEQLPQPPVGSCEEVFAELSRSSPEVARVLEALAKAITDLDRDGAIAAARDVVALGAKRPYCDLADYMGRTWLVEPSEGRGYAARVHQVKRSDHDRALHDHPWHNASIVLDGGYWEVMPGMFQAAIEYRHGDICCNGLRPQSLSEREREDIDSMNLCIQCLGGDEAPVDVRVRLEEMGVIWRAPMSFTPRLAKDLHRLIVPAGRPAWSLFIMRPKQAEWGFLAPQGWVHNEVYLKQFGRDA